MLIILIVITFVDLVKM